jgi:hypothetical protein
MSSESTPILAGAIPSFEMFMTKWEMLAEKFPRLEKWISIGLTWATKYYGRMDRTNAYIISMGEFLSFYMVQSADKYVQVLNPTIRMSWIRKHWDPDYVRNAEEMIKDTVGGRCDLMITLCQLFTNMLN